MGGFPSLSCSVAFAEVKVLQENIKGDIPSKKKKKKWELEGGNGEGWNAQLYF